MPTSDFWTLAREAKLQDMCDSHKYTSSQMADVLGCGRGAVISKVGRMGLKLLPPTDPIALARRGIIPLRRPSRPLPPTQPVGVSMGLQMEDLRDGLCRYPEGFEPPYSFCGNAVVHGTPYCSGHGAICFTKPAPRVR